jgi:putative NADH-flavin reductase
MKVAVFGGSGSIGRSIVREALERGYEVTVAARHPSRLDVPHARLALAIADVTRSDQVARTIEGHDAVVSAVGRRSPAADSTVVSPENDAFLVEAARGIIEGSRRAGVKRVLVVGGAGSLRVTPGLELLDTPDFPAAWRAAALAHREALGIYREIKDLEWTYVSPPAVMARGTRTGRYRLGGDDLLTDETGQSRVSIEDYAVAMVDELERGAHKRARITVAY